MGIIARELSGYCRYSDKYRCFLRLVFCGFLQELKVTLIDLVLALDHVNGVLAEPYALQDLLTALIYKSILVG